MVNYWSAKIFPGISNMQRKSKELQVVRLTGAYYPGARVVMGPLRGVTEPKVRFGTKAAILVLDTEAYPGRKGLNIAHERGD
jgi:hypothetical protein